VETGSENNFRAERVGDAIPTSTPIFSAMPDLNMALPTPSDIDVHQGLKMPIKTRK
jgi:hypothetical protein